MMKMTIVGLMLVLLFASVFMMLNVELVIADSGVIRVPEDFSTIQGAIDAADEGGIVIVSEGVYGEGRINVYKRLTLMANGTVMVDGLQERYVFYITASNVTINGFTVKNGNVAGICLNNVKNCKIEGNTAINNSWNGIWLDRSHGNNITGNTVTINNPGYDIALVGSNGNNISGNTVTNSKYGIALFDSDGNDISGNTATNNTRHGIRVWSSDANNIVGNTATNNNEHGIRLLTGSDGNNISGNNATNNYSSGIRLDFDCNGNTISGNIATNGSCGIWLRYSPGNNISNNTATNNWYGIVLCGSGGNIIYHNNFIDNKRQVYLTDSLANSWDDGYPSGGNYWSDYTGVDAYSGVNQDEPNSDGIGDTPYLIDANNTDRYPLAEPWAERAMIRFLIRTIWSWNLSKGTENSLTSKLDEAIRLLDIGNAEETILKLTDFISQVEAQGGKKITEEQADYLISEAQKIIDLIKA